MGRHQPRAFARFAAALLALLAAGCGGSDDAGDGNDGGTAGSGAGAAASAPEQVSSVLRLWKDVKPAAVSLRPAADAEGELWFRAKFDGSQQYYRMVEAREGVFSFTPFRPRGDKLRLSTAEGRAAVHMAPVVGGRALSLTVRVRPERLSTDVSQMPLVVAAEFKQPFDASHTLSRLDVADLLDPRKQASHVLTGLIGKETLDLRMDFLTDPETVSLGVFMLAPVLDPTRPLVYEALSVTTLGQADFVAGGGELSRIRPLADGQSKESVTAQLDRDEREGLLAVPPASFSFDVPDNQAWTTLDVSLGVRPRDPILKGSVTFVVSADGKELLRRKRTAPADLSDPAWMDLMLPLPQGAKRITLATEAEGDDPPLAVFGHPTLRAEPQKRRPNVLLISLDTLRPDRLGCYGGDASVSPHLDGLAAEGLRYENAYSTSSYTLPSHGSMLTGQFPAFHGAVDVDDTLDVARSPFLATMLADAGWVTAGFTGGGYVGTRYGFGEGFDRYSHNDPVWAHDTVRGRQLMQTMSWERMPIRPALLERYDAGSIETWIDDHKSGPPFFLFVHTYIAHNYSPSEDWLRRRDLLGREGDPEFQRPLNHKARGRFNQGEAGLKDQVYSQYMPYYDATVGTADEFVGRLLASLAAAGVDDDTLVIVTSDHGEEFGEHGFFGHGTSLVEAVTRVPMIARLPRALRGEAGRVVTDPISLVDVAPWILRTVGVEPDPRMAVKPPLGPTNDTPPERDIVLLELDNHVVRASAVREGDLKLVVALGEDGIDREAEGTLLYDVRADPAESRDLAAERADDVARLRARLRHIHKLARAVNPRNGGPVDLSGLDEEQRRELEALGYLGGNEDH